MIGNPIVLKLRSRILAVIRTLALAGVAVFGLAGFALAITPHQYVNTNGAGVGWTPRGPLVVNESLPILKKRGYHKCRERFDAFANDGTVVAFSVWARDCNIVGAVAIEDKRLSP